MPATGKIVILRFSAMGDVAMVAAVLKEFSILHPEQELVMVSRPMFEAFFTGIERLTFHPIQPQNLHKGILGLWKLYNEVKAYQPLAIADLHDNLRSRTLSFFFRLEGIRIKRIDKGRAEKQALTRTKNKVFKQLKPTVERYADVFKSLGFHLKLSHKVQNIKQALPAKAEKLIDTSSHPIIGIAPFAQHRHKVYPLHKMEVVVEKLNRLGYQVVIFGGGKVEQTIAENWASKFINVKNIIGNFTIIEELAIISNLELMLSMDSSGMHMASLMGVNVVSIWGPTHPYAGFLGYGQPYENCIQVDKPWRPNSIYGNKPCPENDHCSMDEIEPEIIINKIIEIVNGKTTPHHSTRKI